MQMNLHAPMAADACTSSNSVPSRVDRSAATNLTNHFWHAEWGMGAIHPLSGSIDVVVCRIEPTHATQGAHGAHLRTQGAAPLAVPRYGYRLTWGTHGRTGGPRE